MGKGIPSWKVVWFGQRTAGRQSQEPHSEGSVCLQLASSPPPSPSSALHPPTTLEGHLLELTFLIAIQR
uniref:Uncharacterized protein n=1 Tax=Equus caballus TaxID=9796 RepID=A0A3Q2HQQ9_HORSE